FDRPGGLWSFLVKLSYVYIPVLALVLGGCLGAWHGAQRTAHRFISTSTDPLVEYATVYVQGFQTFVAALPADELAGLSLEGLIAAEMTQQSDLSPDSYSGQFARMTNEAILTAFLEEAGVPDYVRRPELAVGALQDLSVLSGQLLLIPQRLHQWTSRFFFSYLGLILLGFLPWILVPLAEMGLYHGSQFLAGQPATRPTPQPELV
ncbi:MAG: hypothetical protein KDC54_14810, partial [Lewinella sp.]|nr:hypothetical protein [Lewinella sp.]